MAKDKAQYRTATEDRENPYRKGTAKRAIFAWCLANEPFTREQFDAEVVRLKTEGEIKSVQSDAILPRAWWGELANKAETIVEVE